MGSPYILVALSTSFENSQFLQISLIHIHADFLWSGRDYLTRQSGKPYFTKDKKQKEKKGGGYSRRVKRWKEIKQN